MLLNHYNKFLEIVYALNIEDSTESNVLTGKLINKHNNNEIIPIINGIPRFVNSKNYSDNFGYQWNYFKSTQLDSKSGVKLTSNRFWDNTKWLKSELKGKMILEVGSGAGRFTEILLESEATVVSFDYSNAVDANNANNGNKENLFLFQGDLFNIPFPDEYFDYVFCYGVLQHTPDPVAAYKSIFSKLKKGGKISIDYYLKFDKPNPWSTPKYFWRPITTKFSPKTLLFLIKMYMPIYLPFDTFIRKRRKYGSKILALIPIPCWNYINEGLTDKQRLEWAIMDTFDALGAAYDFPKTLPEVQQMIEDDNNSTVEIFYGSNGVVANVVKK